MRRLFLVIVLLTFLAPLSTLPAQSIPEAPEHMDFCGIELTLNSGARNYIDEFIGKLHRSETYFASLVDKANIYLPIVSEAFEVEKVPQDLKYIIIQESSFNGSAVSKSGAVGYWQMKEPSAREVGLVIDKYIDERKHIYRSSVGAARYFFRINRDFDNWVYAVIGYNRGPVGAKAFIDEKNFGKKTLLVTAKTHWYVLKAIAYKIAFQDEVGKRAPTVSLQAYATGGESSVNQLASLRGIDNETLRKYNPWIKGSNLPKGQNLFYYAPSQGGAIASGEQPGSPNQNAVPGVSGSDSPGSDTSPTETSSPTETPVSQPRSNRDTRRFTYLDRQSDPDYGKYYAILKAGESLPEVAVRTGNKTARIREYNDLRISARPGAGSFIMLKPAKKMRYHIARTGDTWQIIAGKYDLDYKKLMKQNRTRELGSTLVPGQKVYLKGRKPSGEKVILLDTGQLKKPKAKAVTVSPEAPPANHGRKGTQKTSDTSSPPAKGKIHTVKAGETLWRISQDYKVPLENLRKWNDLKGNEIFPGQKLKVGR